jgi:hypothetical protein
MCLLTIGRLQQFYRSADPVCLPSESSGSLGTKIAASTVSTANNWKIRSVNADLLPVPERKKNASFGARHHALTLALTILR